jgi:hypothetical protein
MNPLLSTWNVHRTPQTNKNMSHINNFILDPEKTLSKAFFPAQKRIGADQQASQNTLNFT